MNKIWVLVGERLYGLKWDGGAVGLELMPRILVRRNSDS